MTSICLDAYNLSLPKGTGIASYTRSLLDNNRRLGFENHVLFGPSSARQNDPFANEMALIDVPRPGVGGGRFRAWARTLTSGLGVTAHPVKRTGKVVWPAAAQAATIDHMWAGQSIFARAIRSYHRYGAMTPVRFDQSDAPVPDIMHWTSTLPLYCSNAPNIYTIHDLIPIKLPYAAGGSKTTLLNLCKKELQEQYSDLQQRLAVLQEHAQEHAREEDEFEPGSRPTIPPGGL